MPAVLYWQISCVERYSPNSALITNRYTAARTLNLKEQIGSEDSPAEEQIYQPIDLKVEQQHAEDRGNEENPNHPKLELFLR